MNWIDLGNPHPRTNPKRHTPIHWFQAESIALSRPKDLSKIECSFFETLANRRTLRDFSPLPLDQLSLMMWVTSRTQESGNSDLGFPLSLRPCPSAGAIHPVHLLIIRPSDNNWYRYDPLNHSLNVVPSKVSAQSVWDSMQHVLSAPAATLLLLAAEPGMTLAKYEDAESLVWRDAGVLIGYLTLVAQALGLNLCPLGITGEPWISQLIDQPGLVGVGAAFVGSRPY